MDLGDKVLPGEGLLLRGRGLAYRARGSEFVALVRGGCERDVVELRQEVSAQLDKPLRFEGEELPVSMRYAVVFLDLVDRQPLPILNDLGQRLREGASTLGRAGMARATAGKAPRTATRTRRAAAAWAWARRARLARSAWTP